MSKLAYALSPALCMALGSSRGGGLSGAWVGLRVCSSSHFVEERGLFALRTAWWAVCAVLLAGCGRYGFADEVLGVVRAPVAVVTIGAPADRQLDIGAATVRLAEGLRQRGVEGASWRAPVAGEIVVRCVVDGLETIGVGDTLAATVVLGCEASRGQAVWRISASGEGVVGYDAKSAPAPIELTRRVEGLALARAVDLAAEKLAARLIKEERVRDGGETKAQ
jgi:hypothetical protein